MILPEALNNLLSFDHSSAKQPVCFRRCCLIICESANNRDSVVLSKEFFLGKKTLRKLYHSLSNTWLTHRLPRPRNWPSKAFSQWPVAGRLCFPSTHLEWCHHCGQELFLKVSPINMIFSKHLLLLNANRIKISPRGDFSPFFSLLAMPLKSMCSHQVWLQPVFHLGFWLISALSVSIPESTDCHLTSSVFL